MNSLRLCAALAILPAVPASAQQSIAIASGNGHSSITLTVPFGRTAQFNDLSLRPVQILEDSRCPRFVSCVWRGRLKVSFQVAGGQSLILEDNKPVRAAGGSLTLVGASPISARGEKLPPAAYRFQLRFER